MDVDVIESASNSSSRETNNEVTTDDAHRSEGVRTNIDVDEKKKMKGNRSKQQVPM